MNSVSVHGVLGVLFALTSTSCNATAPTAPLPTIAATPDASPPTIDASTSAIASDMSAAPICPAKAGKLTLYLIAPPAALDWSSPNQLLATAVTSEQAGNTLVAQGQVVLPHEIGHVNLELDCGTNSIPLTGQTGGGNDWQSAGDGFGIVFRDTPGALNETTAGDATDTAADIALRQQTGLVTRVSFLVNDDTCARIKSFHDVYIATGAFNHYGGAFRARRFEGAGCAVWAAGIVDVAGLLRRSLMTPTWARTLLVGSARFADILGKGYYAYGSDFVSRDAAGTSYIWPHGVNVPASITQPIVPGIAAMNSWYGLQDAPFTTSVTLPAAMATKVPFTLYDPQLMVAWAESVWADATANGTTTSLQAQWIASTVQAAHEITYDAHCVAPQTLAFSADNDDLFKDSDAP